MKSRRERRKQRNSLRVDNKDRNPPVVIYEGAPEVRVKIEEYIEVAAENMH
jgi:hypothetical protein